MSRKDKRKRDKAGTKVPAASEQLADAAVEAATSADAGKRSDRAVWRVLLSLVLLLAVVGLPLYLLTLWRLPTRVVVDLVVNRVVFALGDGEEAVPILPSSTSFRALTVEGFERVAFTPKRLEFFSLEARASAGRWIPVSSKGELVLQGVGANGPSGCT